jgi:voltage-gated potassium channel
MKKFLKMLKGLNLFKCAYDATKHQIKVSMLLLVLVTLIFALLMWMAEKSSNPTFDFWDALVWTFVKYVDDPADITTSPITLLGQIVGTLVGVLGIAIFAVPAGLIGSGLMEAMDQKRHEQEIQGFHKRLHKTFRRQMDRSLRGYLNTLPDKGGEAYARLNFVPQFIPLSRLQIRQGMDFKDIHEVSCKYPEVRMKNLAEAISMEENPEDRFVVSISPINTSYGCCIDRQSKVTIVCPVGFSETGTGWFSYYLAKLGGFNYVCKDIEVDVDELDSFYNLTDEPLYNRKPLSAYKPSDKQAKQIIEKKLKHRQEFLNDLNRFNRGSDSWFILIAGHLKSSENPIDFHLCHNRRDGQSDTVRDTAAYEKFAQHFSEEMKRDYGLETITQTQRYPFFKNNLIYRMQEQLQFNGNAFALWPSTQMMIFDTKKILYAYKMANIISNAFDNGKGIDPKDVEDFASHLFGFSENSNLW